MGIARLLVAAAVVAAGYRIATKPPVAEPRPPAQWIGAMLPVGHRPDAIVIVAPPGCPEGALADSIANILGARGVAVDRTDRVEYDREFWSDAQHKAALEEIFSSGRLTVFARGRVAMSPSVDEVLQQAGYATE